MMQTYTLETIDAAPCWRVYVEGRRTSAYIPVIGNPAPVGMRVDQVAEHELINDEYFNQPF